MKIIRFLLVFVLFSVTHKAMTQTYTYNFTSDTEGWTGDFADYPVTDSVFYDLEFDHRALPSPLDPAKQSLMLSGDNHSDDLFMFLKKKISGLDPNTAYQLRFDIEFASNASTNGIGVGGSAGVGVIMKVGASVSEPKKVASGSYYLMNIDKGNQEQPGTDMINIGHVGVAENTTGYTLINRNNNASPFLIQTDSNGEIWVCVGSDSGYESVTTLYYNRIILNFTAPLGTGDASFQNIVLSPNPATDRLYITNATGILESHYSIIDSAGREMTSGLFSGPTSFLNVSWLENGIYFLRIGNYRAFKFLKK